jgi:hypothetical protein
VKTPLRVIVAVESPLRGEFSLVAPDGRVAVIHGNAMAAAVFLVCRGGITRRREMARHPRA